MYIQHCTVLLEHLEHLEHYLGTVVGFLPEKGREVSVWDRVEIMKFYTHAPTFIDPCALLTPCPHTEALHSLSAPVRRRAFSAARGE